MEDASGQASMFVVSERRKWTVFAWWACACPLTDFCIWSKLSFCESVLIEGEVDGEKERQDDRREDRQQREESGEVEENQTHNMSAWR